MCVKFMYVRMHVQIKGRKEISIKLLQRYQTLPTNTYRGQVKIWQYKKLTHTFNH